MEKDKSIAGETPVYVDVSGSNEIIDEKAKDVGHHHEALDSKAANITAYQVEPVQGETHSLKDELLQDEEIDLFKPFPIDEGHPVEDHILTIRALLTGIVLGALVNASNLYLGWCIPPSLEGFTNNLRPENWFHLQRKHVWCHFRVWYCQVSLADHR